MYREICLIACIAGSSKVDYTYNCIKLRGIKLLWFVFLIFLGLGDFRPVGKRVSEQMLFHDQFQPGNWIPGAGVCSLLTVEGSMN